MSKITAVDVRRIQGRVRMAELDAPKSFLELDPAVIAANVNKCGTDDFTGFLVPETIYGYYIGDCCVIHDWDWFDAEATDEAKRVADRRFKYNLTRELKIAMQRNSFYRWIRRLFIRRIKTYYSAVKHIGGAAFWDPKNDC